MSLSHGSLHADSSLLPSRSPVSVSSLMWHRSETTWGSNPAFPLLSVKPQASQTSLSNREKNGIHLIELYYSKLISIKLSEQSLDRVVSTIKVLAIITLALIIIIVEWLKCFT